MDEQKLNKMLSRMAAPEPSKEAKDQALNSAMAAFDKKNQGSAHKDRLTDIPLVNIVRRHFMQKKYVLSGMAGAVSLVAIMAVLGPAMLNPVAGRGGAGRTTLSVDTSSPQAYSGGNTTFAEVGSNVISSSGPSLPSVGKMIDRLASAKAERADMAARSNMGAVPMAAEATNMAAVAPVSPPAYQQQMMAYDSVIEPWYKEEGRDNFVNKDQNPVKVVSAEPVSTFSSDVDTASYTFLRRMITQGVLPNSEAIRPEELINYFPYSYPLPESHEEPFRPTVTVLDSPWKKGNKLVHIGIKGYDMVPTEKPRSNLVFLIDTSGSMNSPDKLPLLRSSLMLLLESLAPEDTVGIVTYAGRAGTALEPTPVKDKQKIIDALNSLASGGGTAGSAGIRAAYDMASRSLDKEGVNRVILATDGDFNIGISDPNALKTYIEGERDKGIFLSVLGFGQGNYNDAIMQSLAQNGNGNAAYIDSLSEARKVLVEEASSTLFTIAKDVKFQVEFNPATVSEYRLIGYETRHLNREDFNNDKVDAGDIGSGHTVTAIYDITPVDGGTPLNDALRYGEAEKPAAKENATDNKGEYAFLKIRYKLPNESTSKLITRPIMPADSVALDVTSEDVRFSTAVAAFADLLKGGKYSGTMTYDEIIRMAETARGKDEFGYRAEFINLVRLAKSIIPAGSAPR